ncbi:unnamed protein product [Spodoptera exigua]|nr:unnamed protein product [Spodoptera exigua]
MFGMGCGMRNDKPFTLSTEQELAISQIQVVDVSGSKTDPQQIRNQSVETVARFHSSPEADKHRCILKSSDDVYRAVYYNIYPLSGGASRVFSFKLQLFVRQPIRQPAITPTRHVSAPLLYSEFVGVSASCFYDFIADPSTRCPFLITAFTGPGVNLSLRGDSTQAPRRTNIDVFLRAATMFTELSIIISTHYPEERLACFPSNFNYSCASRYVSRRSLPRDTFRPLCCALPAKLNKREGGKKGGVRALSNRDPAATAASLVTTYLLARTCTFSLNSRTFPKFPTPRRPPSIATSYRSVASGRSHSTQRNYRLAVFGSAGYSRAVTSRADKVTSHVCAVSARTALRND